MSEKIKALKKKSAEVRINFVNVYIKSGLVDVNQIYYYYYYNDNLMYWNILNYLIYINDLIMNYLIKWMWKMVLSYKRQSVRRERKVRNNAEKQKGYFKCNSNRDGPQYKYSKNPLK